MIDPRKENPLAALLTSDSAAGRSRLAPPSLVRRQGERQRRNRRIGVVLLAAAVVTGGSLTALQLGGDDLVSVDTAASPSPALSTPAISEPPVSNPAASEPPVIRTRTPVATAGVPATVRTSPGWALDRLDQRALPLDETYRATAQGKGVTVYVVDGAFDVTDPEFEGRAKVGLAQGSSCTDATGVDHGLFVAGIIAGRSTGVAPEASLVSVGADFRCEGVGSQTEQAAKAAIVRAVSWVADNARKPAVVNLSFSSRTADPALRAAVKRLTDAGIPVVASAGDEGVDACSTYPSAFLSVISVTGSTELDTPGPLNFGRCVNLLAPGVGVRSVVPAAIDKGRVSRTESASSSWAAAYVSGAVALYLEREPGASIAEVRAWLLDNATTTAVSAGLRGTPNRLLYTGNE